LAHFNSKILREEQSNSATLNCSKARTRERATSPVPRCTRPRRPVAVPRRTRTSRRVYDRWFVCRALVTVRNAGRSLGRCHVLRAHPPAGCAALRHWVAVPARRRTMPSPCRAMALTGPSQSASPPRAGYKSHRSPLARAHRAPPRTIEGPLSSSFPTCAPSLLTSWTSPLAPTGASTAAHCPTLLLLHRGLGNCDHHRLQ
jgi:hypothetical protein